MKMKVCVMYEGRYPFVFDHDPAHPVKDFKAHVRRLLEGTCYPILLFHSDRGQDIIGEDDGSTLDKCGIHDGTTLLLGYRLPFVIRFHCGVFEYMIEVSCFDTIHSLKQKIERRTSISVEEQELEYNEVALSESERTLLSYGIYKVKKDESICDFNVRFTQTTNQYFADRAAEIKNGFSDAQLNGISVSAAKIQVHVKTGYFSEPLTLNLDPTLPLSTLKHALQDKYGSRSDQLLLFLNGKNLLEEENSTLEQCGIESGVTLLLGYTGCFLVKFYGHEHYCVIIEIDCSDTVGRLQQAIAKVTAIPTYEQRLSCIGVNLSDPGRTLFSHGIFRTKIGADMFAVTIDQPESYEVDRPKWITHHSWWDFDAEASRRGVPIGQVFDEHNTSAFIIIPLKDDPSAVHIVFEIPAMKEKFSFRFMPNETVDNVKSVIRQRSYKKFEALKNVSYLRNGEFELEFQGQMLNDNSKTLDCLGIKSGSTVQLYDSRSFGVTILELDNRVRCHLDVHCWLTIRAFKERVYNETQVSPEDQVLYYEDQYLDRDELRLVDYNFLNLTELAKGRKVTVRLVTSNATSQFKEDARCLKQGRVEAEFQLHN